MFPLVHLQLASSHHPKASDGKDDKDTLEKIFFSFRALVGHNCDNQKPSDENKDKDTADDLFHYPQYINLTLFVCVCVYIQVAILFLLFFISSLYEGSTHLTSKVHSFPKTNKTWSNHKV